MHTVLPQTTDDLVAIRVSGDLTAADYEALESLLRDRVRRYGRLRLLIHMDDFTGWDSLEALWGDVKFGAHHARHVERLAMVGDAAWERWATKLGGLFTSGTVRYFDAADLDAAWAWVQGEA